MELYTTQDLAFFKYINSAGNTANENVGIELIVCFSKHEMNH